MRATSQGRPSRKQMRIGHLLLWNPSTILHHRNIRKKKPETEMQSASKEQSWKQKNNREFFIGSSH
uniref:Uncharacterized protein n=1 Tax=Arundo donax TaxID=35708 RepID=A0A0A9HHB9_ARUDO